MKRSFADGDYEFKLGFDEAVEFERGGKRSLFNIMMRMTKEAYYSVADVADLIRLSLIGGGTAPADALRLVEFYVKRAPLGENTKLCIDILEAAFFGEDEPAPVKPAKVKAKRVVKT